MSYTKNFVLKQNVFFVKRLIIACSKFRETNYRKNTRINWTYKYDGNFVENEYEIFKQSPELYLSNQIYDIESNVGDIFAKQLTWRFLFKITMKVLAHWLFICAAKIKHGQESDVYRKCYVDDIESAYPNTPSYVCKWVYPFPIGLIRQLKYIKRCIHLGQNWRFAGIPYSFYDLWRCFRNRDFYSFTRMETRAQIRHAIEINILGYKKIELSDEFDVGSYNFSAAARHLGMQVCNTAHGIGTYMPIHSYSLFRVLTKKQMSYYHSVRGAIYEIYTLSNRIAPTITSNQTCDCGDSVICLVVSSISYGYKEEFELHISEERVTSILSSNFAAEECVKLLYRPHPNNRAPNIPPGFTLAPNLDCISNKKMIVLSFNSTCHIDPTFKGEKILIKDQGLYPEIMLGSDMVAMDPQEIVDYIKALA